MRKAGIYPDDEQAERLAPAGDRNFALAGNFGRVDADSRPIPEIPEDELLRGFCERR